ncbi:hypothetical protein [Aureimonas frigidaquae]|uniref:hypothetical protein n=1 Tax=Aureimonas frigidaquae TaxID=424757 RepID=UPI0012EE0EFB|nr:hypothetical protein [Aureimonas frigidaquae]
MARPKRPLAERIDRLAEWDENHHHHVWTGSTHHGRPRLKPEDKHPVRILLQVDDPRLFVRRVCSHPLCINPDHFKVQVTYDRKYDDRPPPVWVDPRTSDSDSFTPRELEEIQETVQFLLKDEGTFEELTEYHSEEMRQEIHRLWMHKSSPTQLTKP